MSTFSVTLRLLTAVLAVNSVVPQLMTPPSFTSSLPSSTMYFSPNPGEVLPLPCVATGWPKPDYEWRFNDNRLDFTPTQDGTIVLFEPQLAQQGYYQCFARNSVGSALSNKTRVLQATQASFDQTIQPVPKPATVGQKLVIPCQPRTTTVPAPRSTFYNRDFDWKYGTDQSSYPLGNRVQIDENGNLNIAYVTMADNRPNTVLSCYITNRISSISVGGSSVILTVSDPGTGTETPPQIMFYSNRTQNSGDKSTTVVGLEGRNASLRCFFSGSGNVDIVWARNDGQLPTDGRIEQLNYKTELFIKNIQKSDEATYICTGTAASGSTDFPTNFIVQAVPTFKTQDSKPHDVNATVGEDVTINCNPYAIPDASVTWLRNGVVLDPKSNDFLSKFRLSSNGRMLTVLRVCKDNCTTNGPMVIQCNASNVHGYAFANGYLNVFLRTVLTQEPQTVTAQLGQTYNFSVLATSDPNTPITYTWYFRQNEQQDEQVITTQGLYAVSADGTSLTISNVDESVLGKYRAAASNGISADSAEFSLLPPPGLGKASVWPFWWIPFIIILLIVIFIIIVLIVCCCIYQNRGDEYPVDQKEREAERNPEQELADSGFHDYQRPTHRSHDIEKQPLTLERR